MKIKRFTADDVTKAMRQVRRELGPEAVILSTERLPAGGVSISAAVDMAEAPSEVEMGRAGSCSGEALQELADKVTSLGSALNRHMAATEAAFGFSARPEVAPLYHHLASQEVDPEFIGGLLDGLSAPDGAGLLPRLSIRLKKAISAGYPLLVSPGRPVLWALVGPTGVGKTTTVAKLAAHFSLQKRIRVGMITVDTFRMAAAEQLKTYGSIMDVPTLVASSPGGMAKAVEELGDRDLILVDTVGRAPEDAASLEEMGQVLDAAPGLVSHLVLACPTRDRDQDRVVEGFSRFAPKSLIFTKLDETSIYGPILNQMRRTGLPVSYFTNGQKVPDDLEAAQRDFLARCLLPSRRQLDQLSG